MEERGVECFPLSFRHIWREGSRKSVGGADPFLTIWMLVMANGLYTSELIIAIDYTNSKSPDKETQ